MENPFQFGRELGANELVDREDELALVIRALTKGEKLFLIGPRRFGKTSILKSACDRAASKGAIVLNYNAEGYPTLDLLVSAIIADAAKNLKGNVERIGEQIKTFFSRIRPEVSFSVTHNKWKVTLGVTTETPESHTTLLVDALGGLEKLGVAQEGKRSVGLVIDEFQKIVVTGGESAEAQIRAGIQRHKTVGYVFAGSKTRLLTEMTSNASRPLYRLGSLLFIGSVPRQDFSKFLYDRFAQGGFKINDASIKKPDSGPIALIIDSAKEVPYNIQLLAHTCWEILLDQQSQRNQQKSRRALTTEIVNEALERIVRQYDPFYTQLWNQLTAIQQKTLRIVISQGGKSVQSLKAVQMVGKGASTMRRALEALLSRDILREEESGGNVRFCFEDPFFAKWISMFTAAL